MSGTIAHAPAAVSLPRGVAWGKAKLHSLYVGDLEGPKKFCNNLPGATKCAFVALADCTTCHEQSSMPSQTDFRCCLTCSNALEPCNIKSYIYMHLYRYTYTRIHVYMYTHIHIYTYTCIHICMYTSVHVNIYTCTHIHIYTCTHVYMYTCIHACIYAYIHIYTFGTQNCSKNVL